MRKTATKTQMQENKMAITGKPKKRDHKLVMFC